MATHDTKVTITKADRSSYTALDFRQWQEGGTLLLSPKFQRRSVWTMPQKSYLIDTVLRGLPVPPIYLRIRQSDDKKRTIREVIRSGPAQRISAKCSSFLSGSYRTVAYPRCFLRGPNTTTSFHRRCRTHSSAMRSYASPSPGSTTPRSSRSLSRLQY